MRIEIKGKDYKIDYCSLCKDIVLICQHCENSSCSGGGCDICHYAFKNSSKYLKSALIPGELCFRMSLDLRLKMKEVYKERHDLYRQIRKLEKEKKEWIKLQS